MSDDRSGLDEIERGILYHLQEDARGTTNAEISERVGVSATTVGERINDLEERGVIETYHTMVDYETSGFPHRAIVLCNVDANDRREAAAELIERHGVISVRQLLSGDPNLHVEIVGRARDEIVQAIAAIEDAGVDVVGTEMVEDERRKPFDAFQPE